MSVVVMVRGGWEGHCPVEATDRCAGKLPAQEHEVVTSGTLDTYLDADLLRRADLIVRCWTMGTITAEQVAGLAAAVRAGTGLAGWPGGQFVHHLPRFLTYDVRPVSDHPVVAGVGAFAVHTELYRVHVDPAIEVHAVTDVDGVAMPVVCTTRFGVTVCLDPVHVTKGPTRSSTPATGPKPPGSCSHWLPTRREWRRTRYAPRAGRERLDNDHCVIVNALRRHRYKLWRTWDLNDYGTSTAVSIPTTRPRTSRPGVLPRRVHLDDLPVPRRHNRRPTNQLPPAASKLTATGRVSR